MSSYNNRVRAFFENAAFLERASKEPSETLRQRVVIAWRITRMMARLRGYIDESDFLAEMGVDCWQVASAEGREYNIPPYYPAHARLILSSALEKEGFSLVPPSDYGKAAFFEAVAGFGAIIDYRQGSAEDALLGRLGYEPLCDPDIGPIVWPSPEQIIGFEMLLVDEALKQLASGSPQIVQQALYRSFALSSEDCVQVFRMARRQAVEMTRSDLEEDRAIAKIRAESFISRAKESVSFQAEIAGLKHLAAINGLLRFEPVDKERDIIDVISKVSEERKQARIAAKEET